MKPKFGLRAALILLVLIAIAPVFAVVVQASLSEQKTRLDRAQADLRAVVDLGAAHQERLIDGARQVLAAIAYSPAVYGDDHDACADYMKRLQSQYPLAYGTFGVLDAQGSLTCRSAPPPVAVNSSDRLFFRTAVSTGRFSVGEYTVSRASGRPVLTFGLPVLREPGALRGVAYLALDVGQAAEHLGRLKLSPEMTLLVADRNGIVLASAGARKVRVGEPLPERFLLDSVAGGAARIDRAAGADGGEWFYAVQPVGQVREGRLFVASMVSGDQIVAPATERLYFQLAALGLIALLAAGAAWAFGDTIVARPMARLIGRVDALAREELPLSVPSVPTALRELSELDHRFQEMARALAERSVQRDGAMAEMAGQNRLLESILESMAEGVLVLNRAGHFIHVNGAARRIMPGVTSAGKLPASLRAPGDEWGIHHLDDAIIRGHTRMLLNSDGRQYGSVLVFSDVTAEHRASEALKDSERRYRNLFEANPHPMWLFEISTLRFLEVNDAATAHYGWTRDEFLAMTIADIRPTEDVAQMVNASRSANVLQGPALWRHRLKDGRLIYVEISSHSMDFQGRPARMVLAHDVTLRIEAQQALEDANDTLERRVAERTSELAVSNRELESFAYSVSHDLRAPLQVIDGFGRALLSHHLSQLDTRARHYLERIRENTRQMGTLIDDLLSLARVTRTEIKRQRIDVSAKAGQIVDRLRQRDPGRRVDVEIDGPIECEADPGLLGIVLENLLENAWKFTGRTEHALIRVGGRRLPTGELAIFVADNGAGFDMAYVDKLFNPFQRLHVASDFHGTGIGLATVHRIVTRHGGRVWAQAAPGLGAEFQFTLMPGVHDEAQQHQDSAGGGQPRSSGTHPDDAGREQCAQ